MKIIFLRIRFLGKSQAERIPVDKQEKVHQGEEGQESQDHDFCPLEMPEFRVTRGRIAKTSRLRLNKPANKPRREYNQKMRWRICFNPRYKVTARARLAVTSRHLDCHIPKSPMNTRPSRI